MSTSTGVIKPGTRICVGEDDRSIARLLQLELEHRGLVVRAVFDGAAALPAIAAFAPQAIVLDILLPGMDGERVLHHIRGRGITTPVVMLTARNDDASIVAALDAGADDYIAKPFSPRQLVARVRAALRRATGAVA